MMTWSQTNFIIFLIFLIICSSKAAWENDLALNKPACQSSDAVYAHNAVDGDPKTFSMTNYMSHPPHWLVVNLTGRFRIKSIRLNATVQAAYDSEITVLRMNDYNKGANPANDTIHKECGRLKCKGTIFTIKEIACDVDPDEPGYQYIAAMTSSFPLKISSLEVYGLTGSFLGFYNDLSLLAKEEGDVSWRQCAFQCRSDDHFYKAYHYQMDKCYCVDELTCIQGKEHDDLRQVDRVCPVGMFGKQCSQACHCDEGVFCDVATGSCPSGCHEHFSGTHCDSVNKSSMEVGCKGEEMAHPLVDECRNKCISANKNAFTLGQSDKGCECADLDADLDADGSQGCTFTVCPLGFYGFNCSMQCHCNHACLLSDGSCRGECQFGWDGDACDVKACNGDCEEVGRGHSLQTCQKGFTRSSVWHPCDNTKAQQRLGALQHVLVGLVVTALVLLLLIALLLLHRRRRDKKEDDLGSRPDVISNSGHRLVIDPRV